MYIKDGSYEFVIETIITEVRDNYSLYANTQLTAMMYAREKLAPSGVEVYELGQETLIKAPSLVKDTVKAEDNWGDENNISLVDLKKDGPNFTESSSDDVISQGSYIDENNIRWTAIYMNDSPSTKESAFFNFTPDHSQTPKGKVRLSFYKSSDKGYVQTEVREVEASKFRINEIEPGTIVQAVLDTDIKEKVKDHSLGCGASLEAMFANFTIQKIWQEIQPDDSVFRIWTGDKSEEKTIKKTSLAESIDGNPTTMLKETNKLKFEKTASNPSFYKRISYGVEELENEKYILSWSTVDRENLIYTFANREKKKFATETKPTEDDDDDTSQCGSEVYGVTKVNPVDIHSYWYGIEGKENLEYLPMLV